MITMPGTHTSKLNPKNKISSDKSNKKMLSYPNTIYPTKAVSSTQEMNINNKQTISSITPTFHKLAHAYLLSTTLKLFVTSSIIMNILPLDILQETLLLYLPKML